MSSGSPDIVGKAAIARRDYDAGFGAFCGVLRAKPGTRPEWLAYFMQSPLYRSAIAKVITGTNINNLSKQTLANVMVPAVTEDAQEQAVYLLDQATASTATATHHLRAARRTAERLRQAVLVAACSGRLTAVWRASHPNHEAAPALLQKHAVENKDLPINKRRTKPAYGLALANERAAFPESWSYRHIRELVELKAILDIQDGNHGELYPRREDFVTSGGVHFISAESVSDVVELETAPHLKEEVAARLRIGFAKARDVILTHNATVGRVAVLEPDAPSVVLSTSTTYYRADQRVLLPDYLALFMRSPFFQRQLTAAMEQTTRNQVPVTKQVELYVAVPPIEEQARVVEGALALLKNCSRLVSRVAGAHASVDRTAQAILAKAFRGELVPAAPGANVAQSSGEDR